MLLCIRTSKHEGFDLPSILRVYVGKAIDSEQLFGIITKQSVGEWTAKSAVSVLIDFPNPFLTGLDDGAEFLLAFQEVQFRLAAGLALKSLVKRASHHRAESIKIGLHNIVHGALCSKVTLSIRE